MRIIARRLLLLTFFLPALTAAGQELTRLRLDTGSGLGITGFDYKAGPSVILQNSLPLVSYEVCPKNGTDSRRMYTTIHGSAKEPASGMEVTLSDTAGYTPGFRAVITFRNISKDTLWLSNVVPFGFSTDKFCITGKGDHPLSRSHLFRPGFGPVNCILPDNAWELGFSDFSLYDDIRVCALARRIRNSVEKAVRRRFETEIAPGGSVQYNVYADTYSGDWQEGLRMMFRDRMLYDVDPGTFDRTLFDRSDLQWIRHSYVSHLVMAWNGIFYDLKDGRFHFEDFLSRGKRFYGGDDFIGLWPTWPTLGLDQRNQWDLFRDLPGGTAQLKIEAVKLNSLGCRFFICYNPWDESTRTENHAKGMASLVGATHADGVVLDTRGSSSREFQQAADSVRKGVIMYSEGMAVPKDMQGIVAGRVHNALYYCPVLNLNKVIMPEFAIFRVAEIYKEPIRREFNLSFFNGYGTELNIFAPGVPEWAEEQYHYLGRIAMIQRENSACFTSRHMTPLLHTGSDSIWVNGWQKDEKMLYTLYNTRPQGYKGALFEVKPRQGMHFVDLWNHEEKQLVPSAGKWFMEVEADAFNQSWLGTNNEGTVGCIAMFPELLSVDIQGDELTFGASGGDSIRIWAGRPDYEKKPLVLVGKGRSVRLMEHFGRYEGKFVVQLFDKGELADERVIEVVPGTPRLVSRAIPTFPAGTAPAGMVRIPAGKFTFHATNGDEFIPYPQEREGVVMEFPAFFMDKYPVTNRQFKAFLEATGYLPADTANFLKNWKNGSYRPGEANFPVVYVSLEDAKAFAAWAGKRLPTEPEWQYAAQTPAGNEWPWKQSKPIVRKEEVVTGTLTVSRLTGIDPGRCSTGDGKLYPVGNYPGGANPYGLQDLVGCVWQLTNDVYASGSYRYIILKGGSYFNPSSSWWYVQGGPRELHYRQYLLRVSPGFERNGTVGFRCMKDGNPAK